MSDLLLPAALSIGMTTTAAAIGAAVSNKHPAVGAVVAVAALETAAGLLIGRIMESPFSELVLPIIGSTVVVGGASAIGVAVSDRHPSLGAAVGAGIPAVISVGVILANRKNNPQTGTSAPPERLNGVFFP